MRVGSFVGSSRPKRKLPKFWDREARRLAAEQLHPWVWDHAAQLCRRTPPSSGPGRSDGPVRLPRPGEAQPPARPKGGVDLMGQAF